MWTKIAAITIALILAPRINWEWITEKTWKLIKKKDDNDILGV